MVKVIPKEAGTKVLVSQGLDEQDTVVVGGLLI